MAAAAYNLKKYLKFKVKMTQIQVKEVPDSLKNTLFFLLKSFNYLQLANLKTC